MHETTGELPVGWDRQLILRTADGRSQDITEFMLHSEDPDAEAFNQARVLLDFAAMGDGEESLMECEDLVHGIPPYQVIFRRQGDRYFAMFANPADGGVRGFTEIKPMAGAMTIGEYSVWEGGEPRIKEGFFLVAKAYEDNAYRSLRLGPFVDPWSELQVGIHGMAGSGTR